MPLSYRNQKMDLMYLEKQPQKSLEAVHSILTSSIRDLETKLRGLKRSFYGVEMDETDELTKWSTILRRVVNGTGVKGLFSVGQMEDIARTESEGHGAFSKDLLTIRHMMECCRKIEEAVPRGQMEEILVEIKKVLVLMEKYCASFYNLDTDPFIETASAYEKQRRRYINVVNDLVEKIYELAGKFRSSGEGVRLLNLSAYSVELSRRTDTAHAPFLLLFPEACENIRLALAALRSWIDDDRNFVGFLENDAREMERRRTEVEKQQRLHSQTYHQLNFRRKQNQLEAEQLEVELQKSQNREDALIVDEELLSNQVSEMERELDSTEFRRSEWIRNGTEDRSGSEYYDKLNEFSDRIRILKAKLPSAQQQLTSLRVKLKKVENKRTELRAEGKRSHQLDAEIDDVSSRLAENELELSGITHALETARKIILCKKSSDVIEKIFYDQRIVKMEKNKKKGEHSRDVFDKACTVVANRISKDWPTLYRVLPFHPPRGLATIDQDIYDLLNRETRGGKRQLARLSLDRWRRNHTRAKVEDLEVALEAIRRSDIVHHMYTQVRPKEPEVVVQSEIPDWVDAKLVPYWREIERYDEIMATNNRIKQKQRLTMNE